MTADQIDDFPLGGAGVLQFIHEDVAVTFLHGLADVAVGLEEVARLFVEAGEVDGGEGGLAAAELFVEGEEDFDEEEAVGVVFDRVDVLFELAEAGAKGLDAFVEWMRLSEWLEVDLQACGLGPGKPAEGVEPGPENGDAGGLLLGLRRWAGGEEACGEVADLSGLGVEVGHGDGDTEGAGDITGAADSFVEGEEVVAEQVGVGAPDC